MVKIREIEIHSTFKGDIMIQRSDGTIVVFDEKNSDFTNELYAFIARHFPGAMKALLQSYKRHRPNLPLFKYKVVSRFLRCNLGGHDNMLDFESDGQINLEFVPCPLRGECEHENVICRPKSDHPLTPMEFKVMRGFYDKKSVKEIADLLGMAENTCKKHKQNALNKTECGNLVEFIRYADSHNLFNR